MRVEQKSYCFKPVTIILETKDEVHWFLAAVQKVPNKPAIVIDLINKLRCDISW